MSYDAQTERMLSASALSRELNVPVSQIHAALAAGKIKADGQSAKAILFKQRNVSALHDALGLRTPLIAKLASIADGAERTRWFRENKPALFAERALALTPDASVHTKEERAALKAEYDRLKSQPNL